MSIAFSVVGCVVVVMLAASLFVSAIGYLIHCRAEAKWRADQLIARDSKRDVGARMTTLCHWFSEDVAAWKVVQIIGLELQRTGDFDVSACRERWRQEVRDHVNDRRPAIAS